MTSTLEIVRLQLTEGDHDAISRKALVLDYEEKLFGLFSNIVLILKHIPRCVLRI